MKKYSTPELDIKNTYMPLVMEKGDSVHDLNFDVGGNWPTQE